MKELQTGLKGKYETKVVFENTAAAGDSTLPAVFSTPKLLEILEYASIDAVRAFYDEGELTVGLSADITHMGASPIGKNIRAESELIEINGKVLTFKVSAFDDDKQIAKGTHKRAVIIKEKFLQSLK